MLSSKHWNPLPGKTTTLCHEKTGNYGSKHSSPMIFSNSSFPANESFSASMLSRNRCCKTSSQPLRKAVEVRPLSKVHWICHQHFTAVSEADIADWRARTVSCGQKLGPATPIALFHNLAHATLRDLGPIGPPNFSEEKEAERAMTSIYHTAFDLAILFRSNKVSYSWLQNKSPSSISIAEAGIAGVTQLDCPGLWKPWRVIFGELVKSGDSEGDRFVLAKPEVLFD